MPVAYALEIVESLTEAEMLGEVAGQAPGGVEVSETIPGLSRFVTAQVVREKAVALFQGKTREGAKKLLADVRGAKAEIRNALKSLEDDGALAAFLEKTAEELFGAIRRLEMQKSLLAEAGQCPTELGFMLGGITHDVGERFVSWIRMGAENLRKGKLGTRKHLEEVFRPVTPVVVYLIANVFDLFREQALAKGILYPGEETGVFERIEGRHAVFASPIADSEDKMELIEAVLANLVENGIKYADPDKRYRQIGIFFHPETGILEYEDNGIGMAPEFAARLGDEPMREGRAEGVKGTGTGWTIIAHNLRALGWSWEIETEPGAGTKVRIKIPEKDLVF